MFHISDLTFLRNKHGWMDGGGRQWEIPSKLES